MSTQEVNLVSVSGLTVTEPLKLTKIFILDYDSCLLTLACSIMFLYNMKPINTYMSDNFK